MNIQCKIGILSTVFLSILSTLTADLDFKNDNFFIRPGYLSRTTYTHHDDRHFTDGNQNEIYLYAYKLAVEEGIESIYDVGCGSAFKLLKYFKQFDITGFEIEPTLSWLKKRYPKHQWKLSDLSLRPTNKKVDLIICSDVIEHLVNPDELLNFINHLDFKYLILSTPDRDKLLEHQKRFLLSAIVCKQRVGCFRFHMIP